MPESFFFVIEGVDGAGKTGIARQLQNTLSQTHGQDVAFTYEPHNPSAAGSYIREVLAQRKNASALALALAFALNRADHLDQVINPFLHGGARRIVICDRYLLSSLVYQSTGGLSMDDVYGLNRWARMPDLTVYLNVSPHQGYARMRNRPNDRELFERNLAERGERYQAAIALLRAKGETVMEVDANPAYDKVFAAVLAALKAKGPAWLRIQPPLLLDLSHDTDTEDSPA